MNGFPLPLFVTCTLWHDPVVHRACLFQQRRKILSFRTAAAPVHSAQRRAPRATWCDAREPATVVTGLLSRLMQRVPDALALAQRVHPQVLPLEMRWPCPACTPVGALTGVRWVTAPTNGLCMSAASGISWSSCHEFPASGCASSKCCAPFSAGPKRGGWGCCWHGGYYQAACECNSPCHDSVALLQAKWHRVHNMLDVRPLARSQHPRNCTARPDAHRKLWCHLSTYATSLCHRRL